ncbi:inorganic diphosphatase [Candidatus Beckwithbacteria bacterium]|nr:inorganic diphosphatase [Candidatus Beckwithbacteria bacterium]
MAKKTIVDIIIEISSSSSVKYELDEKTGRIYVDRFLPTPMAYPENYGLVEHTLGQDGDALDALVLTSEPVAPGTWIKAEVIGMLAMEDEKGGDCKLICVPATRSIDAEFGPWTKLSDVPRHRLHRIEHFFAHYKDLEKGKWVKIKRFANKIEALKELKNSQDRFKQII